MIFLSKGVIFRFHVNFSGTVEQTTSLTKNELPIGWRVSSQHCQGLSPCWTLSVWLELLDTRQGVFTWSWSILVVFQWIKLYVYIIYIYMQNTFKGKHIHVSPKCLRSLNFCCGFRSKVWVLLLDFLKSLILYYFFLFIKRFEVRYRVLVVSDLVVGL